MNVQAIAKSLVTKQAAFNTLHAAAIVGGVWYGKGAVKNITSATQVWGAALKTEWDNTANNTKVERAKNVSKASLTAVKTSGFAILKLAGIFVAVSSVSQKSTLDLSGKAKSLVNGGVNTSVKVSNRVGSFVNNGLGRGADLARDLFEKAMKKTAAAPTTAA